MQAVLARAPHDVNCEVVKTDGQTQRRTIDVSLDLLGICPMEP